MKTQQTRRAFSMVTAIVIIILMSTVAVFVMNLSGKTVKSTTIQFQREQAELYAKSYTEYAVMAVTANDRSVDCISMIQGDIGSPTSGNGYHIDTHISYIANGTDVDLSQCNNEDILNQTVQTKSTPLSIMIDVYVKYKDPDNPNGPWFTVHRRSIQKI